MALNGIDVRCSAIVFRRDAVLLVGRTYGGTAVWTLPGGTPREAESTAACARRELFEETGVSADPSRVAFVFEAMTPGGGRRTLDIVFLTAGLEPGAEPQAREPGVEPRFIPVDQLAELTLLPPVAGHLRGLLHGGIYRYAPTWVTCGGPWTAPQPVPGRRSPGSAELLAMRRGHAVVSGVPR